MPICVIRENRTYLMMYNVQCTMYNVQSQYVRTYVHTYMHACMHACIHVLYPNAYDANIVFSCYLPVIYACSCYPPMACQEKGEGWGSGCVVDIGGAIPATSGRAMPGSSVVDGEQWNVVSLDEWVDQECYKGIYYIYYIISGLMMFNVRITNSSNH